LTRTAAPRPPPTRLAFSASTPLRRTRSETGAPNRSSAFASTPTTGI